MLGSIIRDIFWRTYALHAAANKNNLEEIKLLVADGRDLNQRDEHGHTPLFISIRAWSYECTTWLLDHGADPNRLCRPPAHAEAFFTSMEFVTPLQYYVYFPSNVKKELRNDVMVQRAGIVKLLTLYGAKDTVRHPITGEEIHLTFPAPYLQKKFEDTKILYEKIEKLKSQIDQGTPEENYECCQELMLIWDEISEKEKMPVFQDFYREKARAYAEKLFTYRREYLNSFLDEQGFTHDLPEMRLNQIIKIIKEQRVTIRKEGTPTAGEIRYELAAVTESRRSAVAPGDASDLNPLTVRKSAPPSTEAIVTATDTEHTPLLSRAPATSEADLSERPNYYEADSTNSAAFWQPAAEKDTSRDTPKAPRVVSYPSADIAPKTPADSAQKNAHSFP